MNNNYAYISLVATNNYIGAAVIMMTAGKRLKSKYPFYLMVTENITEDNKTILKALGYYLIDIEEWRPHPYDIQKQTAYKPLVIDGHGVNPEDRGGQHTFSKILIGKLVQFDKVCGLDLDIVFFKNIDDVFDLPCPAGLGLDINNYSSSQIFVIEPNGQTYRKLIECGETGELQSNPETEDNTPGLFTDEQIIHKVFQDKILGYTNIPLTYSYSGNRCSIKYTLLEDLPQIRGVHITGNSKPGLLGKDHVNNFAHEGYYASFIGYYCISLYNKGVKELKTQNIDLPLLDE